ncbi:MAG: hypothetical protein KGM98_05205 [Bacteroidota bacterium]|nr:hypothetical protein [Bacteroidota bacterium]
MIDLVGSISIITEVIDQICPAFHKSPAPGDIRKTHPGAKPQSEGLEALREALVNAIAHKDYTGTTIQIKVYDDKLVIWNPGTLPDHLNIEQL